MPQRLEVLEKAPLEGPPPASPEGHCQGLVTSHCATQLQGGGSRSSVTSKGSTKSQLDLHAVCRPEDKHPSGSEAGGHQLPHNVRTQPVYLHFNTSPCATPHLVPHPHQLPFSEGQLPPSYFPIPGERGLPWWLRR